MRTTALFQAISFKYIRLEDIERLEAIYTCNYVVKVVYYIKTN